MRYPYRSYDNLKRVARGYAAVRSGNVVQDALPTAASDTVANILHALHSSGEITRDTADEFLQRALRTFEGDFEDEPGDSHA